MPRGVAVSRGSAMKARMAAMRVCGGTAALAVANPDSEFHAGRNEAMPNASGTISRS